MKQENKEIIKISVKEILLYLVDINILLMQPFDRHQLYRKSINDYWRWRAMDRSRFSQNLYRLKKAKLIRTYQEGKEKYVELTTRGLDKVKNYSLGDLKIDLPKVWDKKWRMVIFDIPDDKVVARNILREKLKNFGFVFLQESVFIFPFECKREIDFICDNYYIKPYVKYILADILEGDDELIERFCDLEILSPAMIKR